MISDFAQAVSADRSVVWERWTLRSSDQTPCVQPDLDHDPDGGFLFFRLPDPAGQRENWRVAVQPAPAAQLRVRVAVPPLGPTVLRVEVHAPPEQVRVCAVAPP